MSGFAALRLARRWAMDTHGTSALEFVIAAPLFGLLLAGAIDFGGALFTKFSLDGAVSAAGNYALLNAASASSSAGAGLATSLATVVASGHATNWANATIVVDNGPSATSFGGVVTSAGTASNADLCYCPTKAGTGITWGAPATCGATCTGGSLAGKYVTIVATHIYKPFFSSYGLVGNGLITASAVVQTQ